MRCRDATRLLAAQRDGDLAESDALELQEHLQHCADCRAIKEQQQTMEKLLFSTAPRVQGHVSTEHIMQAVEQQRQVSQQLEDIRQQQQVRVARLSPVVTPIGAILLFTLASIPLLLLAISIIRTDLVARVVSSPLTVVIDILVLGGRYLQTGLTWATRSNLLLSVIAFAFVVMMGMWLRLMRHPGEA